MNAHTVVGGDNGGDAAYFTGKNSEPGNKQGYDEVDQKGFNT